MPVYDVNVMIDAYGGETMRVVSPDRESAKVAALAAHIAMYGETPGGVVTGEVSLVSETSQ